MKNYQFQYAMTWSIFSHFNVKIKEDFQKNTAGSNKVDEDFIEK